MTTISAKTILRSRNASAPEHVLSTLLLRYPRWIHAENRTHRVESIGEDFEISLKTPALMDDPSLSRNAASSRAIPVTKLIDDIRADPAEPLWWGRNQSGMQAFEELGGAELNEAKRIWRQAMNYALLCAESLARVGAHKQIVNRLLEPFSHITVLVSATEWSNFLELRDHSDAEPHIRMLAQEIRKCLDDESTIRTLEPGQWHLPFIEDEAAEHWLDAYGGGQGYVGDALERARFNCTHDLLKLSAARCASTSYKTVDGFDMTLERAEQVFDKLVTSKPIHASPFEHVACADEYSGSIEGPEYDSPFMVWPQYHQHRNFVGFRQYRAMIGA